MIATRRRFEPSESLDDALTEARRYRQYAYAYPHKTAYRSLSPARPLGPLLASCKGPRLLYIHLPFCQARCGYCNLLSTGTDPDLRRHYLRALRRQMRVVRRAIPDGEYAGLVLGGGTPTAVPLDDLRSLLRSITEELGVSPTRIPTAVEVSPSTATDAAMAYLRDCGVERISVGVQTFSDSEARTLGRHQTRAMAESALARIREMTFPRWSLDLIYGIPGQDAGSWRESIGRALAACPNEIYLYPLYVRSGTAMAARRARASGDLLKLYRQGRDRLLEAGYEQMSMRHFVRSSPSRVMDYCCQEDGMVGLGCGARSYTASWQFSDPFAVDPRAVRRLVESYAARTEDAFAWVRHGFFLDAEDQARRYLIKSLLKQPGVAFDDYRRVFGANLLSDFPCLDALIQRGLAAGSITHVALTETGLEWSDSLSLWLASTRVRALMAQGDTS